MPIAALNRKLLHLGVIQVAAHLDNAAADLPLTKLAEPWWLHTNQFDIDFQVVV